MEQFKTVVIVDHRIYNKIQLYRSFLENSTFNTLLSDTIFISDDSAEDKSSAELSISDTVNCLYLYGLIDKDEYKRRRDAICNKLKSFQNTSFYMLFCQNMVTDGNNYDVLMECNAQIQEKPFCIGILEQTDIPDENADDTILENLRCVKLLALAVAICSFKEETGVNYSPQYYYSTASVTLNYENVFNAAGYELSNFAEQIALKGKQITELENIIQKIKKEKPHKCIGNFTDQLSTDSFPTLHEFSEYKSIEAMRREIEAVGNRCTDLFDESVISKIKTARLGLAYAEEKIKPTIHTDGNGTVDSIDVNYEVANDYMTVTVAEEAEVPAPEELLERPDGNLGFDTTKIRSAIPLAKELEKSEKPGAKKVFPIVLTVLLFFILATGTYLVRYLKSGLVDVDVKDILLSLGLPAAVILFSAIIAIFISLFGRAKNMKVFKELHANLKIFLDKLKNCCDNINVYINKYLTVYFNHHIKYSIIKKFKEDIALLKKDIYTLKEQSHPYDELAQSMSRLSGKKFDAPDKELNRDGSLEYTVTQSIVQRIKNSKPTRHSEGPNTATQELNSPWIFELNIELGSFDSKE